MDPSALLAIALSMGMILGGNAIEGGHLASLTQPTALMIVMGGTLGATWLSATPGELKLMFKLSPRLFKPALANREELLQEMLRITTVVRRDGMLAVEGQLASVKDEMLRRGLQMLVDGNAGEDVRSALETEADMHEHHGTNAAKLYETAGGFAPTIGILGAVLGLIHVMQNLSDPSKLGTGIAVAFVATIYGVGLANLFFLPIGARLKKIVAAEAEDRNMIITGLSGIAAGSNARQIAEMLGPWCKGHGAAAGARAQSEAA
jgi:chemotaxis protein MotA